VTDADLHAQYQFGRMVRDKVTEANDAVIAIRRVKEQLDIATSTSDDRRGSYRGPEAAGQSASDVEENIYQVKNQSGQDPLNFPIRSTIVSPICCPWPSAATARRAPTCRRSSRS
jgi:hypothetical protein